MEIKYGLISSDSHGQLGKDAYTTRMSKAKWGDRVPHVIEVPDEKFDHPVERWVVDGEVQGGNVCNCPTAMKERGYYPQRWEEVPREVYDPAQRLIALDRGNLPNPQTAGKVQSSAIIRFASRSPERYAPCTVPANLHDVASPAKKRRSLNGCASVL